MERNKHLQNSFSLFIASATILECNNYLQILITRKVDVHNFIVLKFRIFSQKLGKAGC